MSKLVQIMRTLRSMPPLPSVAQRVLQIVRDPEYSIDSMVTVVRTDPSLTTRILKLCNSSLYGLEQEVTNVSDAVAFIGTRNLVKLVLVSCTASYYRELRQSRYADPTELWKHTLSCATACQFLAERCGYEQPATAFTAGILHNIGKVALAQVVDDEQLMLLDTAAETFAGKTYVAVEREVLGLDHASAGGLVTESWNLPVDLRRAVRNHHDPTHLRNDGDLTALLHTADLVVLGSGVGNPFPTLQHTVAPEALERLRLQQSDLDEVLAHVKVELQRFADLLNLDLLSGR